MLGNSYQDEDDLRARLRVMTNISQKLANEKDALIETCKRLDSELNLKSKENERLKRMEDVDGISTRSASEIITKLSEELKRSATEQKILAHDLQKERENNLKLKRDLAQTSESFNQISSDLKKSAIEYYSIIGDYEQEMETKVAKLKALEMEKIRLEHDREFEAIHKQHEIEKERALESLRSELQKRFDANTKELQNATKQFNEKLEADKSQVIERLQNELEAQFEAWKKENETKHQQILKEKEKALKNEKDKAVQEVQNRILPLEEEIKRLVEHKKLDTLEVERKLIEKDQETAKVVAIKEKLEYDLKKTTDDFTGQIATLNEQLEKEKNELKRDFESQIQELQSIKPRNEVERDLNIQTLKDQLKVFEGMNQELCNSLKECELQINQLKQQVLLQKDEKDELQSERVDLLNSISLLGKRDQNIEILQ